MEKELQDLSHRELHIHVEIGVNDFIPMVTVYYIQEHYAFMR